MTVAAEGCEISRAKGVTKNASTAPKRKRNWETHLKLEGGKRQTRSHWRARKKTCKTGRKQGSFGSAPPRIESKKRCAKEMERKICGSLKSHRLNAGRPALGDRDAKPSAFDQG